MKLPFAFGRNQDSLEQGQDGEAYLDGGPSTEDEYCSEGQSIRGLSDLYIPEETGESYVDDITDVLLELGKLTAEQLAQVHQEQSAEPGSDVTAILLEHQLVSTDDILEARAQQHELEFRHIKAEDVEKEAFKKLDVDFIKNNSICPVAIEGETLIVATSEPTNVFAIEDVKRQTQMSLQVVVCSAEEIEAVCDSFGQSEGLEYCVDDIISDLTDVEVIHDEDGDSEDLEKMAGQSPVIKFVNYLISNAIHDGVSDIHIEPKEKCTKIRHRIDGVLFEVMESPQKMHPAVVSRVKIMSNLDISERRLPQDGKISVVVRGRQIDLRVSVLPTSHGEKVVIRILDSKSMMLDLEQLGMAPDVTDVFRKQISAPNGILLVTGPTGSGKSTTLYSALCQMDGNRLNISTVEDPVEYQLDFCNQVQTNDKIGMDFASALRSLLRQDPDIIMIGEIRDNETARIAVQAALTGHLVLSTLHTNDAASSITRLVNIGIDPYLIAASLNAVLAQRLVRRICPKCKEPYVVPENMRKYIEEAGVSSEELFHGAGCDHCRGSGYVGRVGIYELLVIDELFRDMINKDSSVANMRRTFHESGKPTLFNDGIAKVKQGMTTIEEVLRVTKVYGQNEDEIFVENIS
ncbi:MAG: GspE/PulE family protein [Planctomycetota bacterium]|jgi:type IV pilus assembly protein PilB